jgi:hypothetical protein
MAVRENIDSPWQTIRRYHELEIENYQTACSLTADEKMIMYETAAFGGAGIKRIFTATRNSIEEPFSNLQERYELEAIDALGPTMTPDGLTVYFIKKNEADLSEAWVGHRDSLDAPFGDFRPLNDINQYAIGTGSWYSQSWNGQRMYVRQRWGEPEALAVKGIYVYHWVDPPEAKAGKNILRAIEQKQQILDQLAATIDMEIETLHILDWLQEPLDKSDPAYRAIHWTKVNIRKSLEKETNAQIEITKSITDLQNAIDEYPYWPPAL